MKLLLDTCTFLWMASDQARLSEASRSQLINPANELFLSSMSAWEIVIKNYQEKLLLPQPPRLFIPEKRKQHGIEVLPLDEESVMQLDRLPGIHKDPFARMMICQVIAHGMFMLAPGPLITQYPVSTAC